MSEAGGKGWEVKPSDGDGGREVLSHSMPSGLHLFIIIKITKNLNQTWFPPSRLCPTDERFNFDLGSLMDPIQKDSSTILN